MKTIHLAAKWSYHSVPKTIDFPAGTHEVTDEVYQQAVAAGAHKESDNGGGTAKARPARAADAAEG